MLLQSNKCATPDCEYDTNEKSNVLLQIHTSLTMYAGCAQFKELQGRFFLYRMPSGTAAAHVKPRTDRSLTHGQSMFS
jgi:hypothetical protein